MSKFEINTNIYQLIKDTPDSQLQTIADDLRTELIDNVAVTGGHLASNLGVVELTVALNKVFDFPKDKIIWDVGHQAYVEKMISGRLPEMKTIRKHNGLSGFPKRAESDFDMYDSGHSSTSISAALGYAAARDLNGDNYNCIAVIGDGALTGGVAFEGLNNAGAYNKPFIVILNDNQMSIGGSVGATSNFLSKLRLSKAYRNFKNTIKTINKNTPGVIKFFKNLRDLIKSLFVPDQIFEELGFKYYGPINGHNLEELLMYLRFAKETDRPVLLHVMTVKGKGFKPAEDNPSKFHGIGSFDKDLVDSNDVIDENSWSAKFGKALCSVADANENVVAISAAMVNATGLSCMQKSYPERVFDVGIAEQHAVSFAAGLALNGKIPVVAIYSTFLQRAYDEIITEVCLQNLPVVFAIDRAGVTGPDGETHQGMFDIAYLNSMPNMTILSPVDENSLKKCLAYAVSLGTPCAIRYGKSKVPDNITELNSTIPSYTLLRDGYIAAIIADGAFTPTALEISDKFNGTIAVIHAEKLKNLDEEQTSKILRKYKKLITIEDGTVIGGFGSVISAVAAKQDEKIRVLNLGWPDKFIEHGTISELRKVYGLDTDSLVNTIGDFLEN